MNTSNLSSSKAVKGGRVTGSTVGSGAINNFGSSGPGFRLGAANPGTVIATVGGKYVNAKNLQQNYMRGYSPSKPLWK